MSSVCTGKDAGRNCGTWYGVGPSVGLAGYGESSWPSCPLVCLYTGVGPRVCVFL